MHYMPTLALRSVITPNYGITRLVIYFLAYIYNFITVPATHWIDEQGRGEERSVPHSHDGGGDTAAPAHTTHGMGIQREFLK